MYTIQNNLCSKHSQALLTTGICWVILHVYSRTKSYTACISAKLPTH